MQNLDKLLIGIMALGYMIAAVFLVMISLGWTGPWNYIENYLLYTSNRWLLGLVGTVVFIAALTLFFGSVRTKPVRTAVIHETSLGLVNITIPALEHLVVKAARSVQGIREVKPLLKRTEGGLAVQLKVQVQPYIGIPGLTEELQTKVKEYLIKTVGITVNSIKVSVYKINWEAKNRVE